MTDGLLSKDFRLSSIYILESFNNESEINRGSCFSISNGLVLTAKHVVEDYSTHRCYLKSDDFSHKEYQLLEVVYTAPDWDFAILRNKNSIFDSFIPLGNIKVGLNEVLKSCGYPIEKGYIAAPININVTTLYDEVLTHHYSYEVTQSTTVSKYKGMSGSPVLYKGYTVGVLVVQQGKATLKVISIFDILSRIGQLKN
jgi:hypothetical protein